MAHFFKKNNAFRSKCKKDKVLIVPLYFYIYWEVLLSIGLLVPGDMVMGGD